MLKYIGKRLLWMLPVVLGISFILFTIMDLTPGDPARVILGEYASQEDVDALREEMGLNDNFFVRYGKYIVSAVTGDLGQSYRTGVPVVEEIAARFPVTLKIAVMAMFIAVFIGIPVGIISAVRQYSFADIVATMSALAFTSIPAFWLGLLLILLLSVQLHLLPAIGSDSWKHLIMPSVSLAAAQMATIMRMTRSTMLEVIRQDYIRTAKAKGAEPRRIIFHHAIKNALLPVITTVGLSISNLLGGALIIENVFGISGLGTLMVNSVKSKDAPMLIGSVMFAAVVAGLVNLSVDVLYTYIDPRIKAQFVKRRK
ncbi:ABC transporter permease [Enterocloster sp.]|jgi:peptide/nickel transport system permease protein|uniref:ABC transporter permease n=1 Tax=Enterocloster sp. TaxID=2719315 RepID=UPI00307DD348